MESLMQKQFDIGTRIEKLWINFNKDSKDRKTEDYLKRKSELLEEEWENFEAGDDQLREIGGDVVATDYFTKNFYQQVQSVYLKLKVALTNVMKQQDTPATNINSSTGAIPKQARASVTNNVNLLASLKNAMKTMESFLETEISGDTSEIIIEHMSNRIEKYLKILEEKESVISIEGNNYPERELQELQAKAEAKLMELKSRMVPDAPHIHAPHIQQPMMQLTKISVPKFDGDTAKWTQFHDLFKQLVHEQHMSKAMKMFYLKDNLHGEAERLIRHLQVSDANYDAAWSILKNKYDDKRALLDRWLTMITTIKPMVTESAEAVKKMHDLVREATLAVDSLNIPSKQLWEAMVMFITAQKLDSTSRTLYEQSLENPQDIQPLESFIKFLQTRYRSLNVQGINVINKGKLVRTTMVSTTASRLEHPTCPVCEGDHAIYQCDKFLNQNLQERNMLAFKAKLCLNCLKKGHFASACKARSCFKCGKKHNTLLHMSAGREAPAKTNPTSLNVSAQRNEKHIFLATAMVEVRDRHGTWITCRALIDSGSQVNIATERLRKRLQLDSYKVNQGLTGLGESRVKVNNRMQVTIRSGQSSSNITIEALVMKQITSNQPQVHVDISQWKIPHNVQLADPKFNEPQNIDILLGAELYNEIMLSHKIQLREDLPTLHESVFGWVVIGAASTQVSREPSYFCGISTLQLDDQIRQFWELEEYMPRKRFTQEETKCEEFFDATTYRDNGRFIVNIPLKNSASVLGDSKAMAFKRLLCIERKLSHDDNLKQQYVNFMQDYEKQGHMKEISDIQSHGPKYYLPHHCVLKPSSTTTKLRVVFDASAKTSNNISLNDIMMNGPRIQDEIFAILLRFRTKKYVFTADIKQMYRQLTMAEEDRNLQLILWRENPTQPIKTYQLTTVTYGTKSAPYLATKCLQRLAEDEEAKFPKASKASRDFYVDDIITGCDELEEAIETQNQLHRMLEAGGFQLRKWCANHPRLIEGIPEEHLEMKLDFDNKHEGSTKPLGLTWHPIVDQFEPTVCLKEHQFVTKRSILGDIAQLFDPLGLVNPVVVQAKIFMQQLWKMKLDWDSELPAELQTKWLEYRHGMSTLKELKIPRYVFNSHYSGRVVLHAFADASEKAYGVAIYLRSKAKDGEATVRLLCAKSRVAPLKTTKLPLLELCAAKMAAEFVKVVIDSLAIALDDVYYWSDSQIVLHWIQREPATLVTFVANRVAEIQTMTNVRKWQYVPTEDNPADIISRGCSAKQLAKDTKWFSGPEFLKHSHREWPRAHSKEYDASEYDRTLKLVLTIKNESNPSLIDQIDHKNSFRKLQRIMAFIVRAVQRFKQKVKYSIIRNYSHTNVTCHELDMATKHILKEVQTSEYGEELKCLNQRKPLPKGNNLASLTPFIGTDGLIRVGGRLEEAPLTYDEKHPILLPHKHWVTRLYMVDVHVYNLHAGPQAMTAISRQRIWVIQGRQLARSIVNNCLRCARVQPKCAKQIMGQLPVDRVTAARPFINCGIDFCGPVWTHFNVRGRKAEKSYIAVFCCFATRAVHFEVVANLTTDAFIGALKRFIARRGACQNIYCDNGRNFVGANNKFVELQQIIFGKGAQEKIENLCSPRRIKFNFIPPRAPHMGGLWEASVKSLKRLMYRTMTSTALTYDELCTVVAEIEAVLNSRPLTPLSSNPNDLNALTPGHFLIGEPMTATVDPQASDQHMKLLSRWQLVSYCRAEFWKRWSIEYINNLQVRAKWVKEYPDMVIGTLVLIKEDNLPPLQWVMGRIVDVLHGRDGHVRVAYVRTATGIVKRAIHNLAPLPVEFESDNPLKDGEDMVKNQREDENARTQPQQKRQSSKRRNDGYTTNVQQAKSRPKCATAYTTITIMMTLLLLPLAFAARVNIQPLRTNPGLYYDRIGQLRVSPTHWTVMVYFNLTGYHALSDGISTILDRMKTTIETIDQPDPYKQILTHFERRLQHIQEFNKVLLGQTNNRNKRAAINIVGTAFNRLFGILDQEYAEEMKATLKNVNSNEQQLSQLLQNQTSILDSTVNLIKKDRQEIMSHILKIKNTIKGDLINLSNAASKDFLQSRTIDYFNLLSSLAASYFQDYEQIQDNIADITLGIHQGHTSLHIISPDQLHEQLQLIRQQLSA